ncbi:hypothetical protein JCM10207_007187 [Rhodosporidiobolus poonsookiae]
MPAVVTLLPPPPHKAATPPSASQPSQAGKAKIKATSSKPYNRPDAPKKEQDEDKPDVNLLPFLERPPPPFPTRSAERLAYRRPEWKAGGRQITAFQWRLYDTLVKIPTGKVTTYGQLAAVLSSSARAVGSALRSNPFAPTVPCHRIIASTGFIGGFDGEWTGGPGGSAAKSNSAGKGTKDKAFVPGSSVSDKLELLRREGVTFDKKGFLEDKGQLWDGKEGL